MLQTEATYNRPALLGLGTAQFGHDYGVTNKNGRPIDAVVANILSDALKNEIGVIDTAPAYGDAETRLGELLPENYECPIVTKTVVNSQLTRLDKDDVKNVRDRFLMSLRNLRRDAVYGLLVHLGSDVLLPGGERLIETLVALRDNGFVQKVGVSIYTADELDGILKIFTPEIVQLPLNIADQRLLQSGHLAKLKALGSEIHVRSVFLQGVLLAEPKTLPDFMRRYAPSLRRIRTAYPGASPLQLCLAFAGQIPEADCLILGAATSEEWRSIQEAYEQTREIEVDFGSLAIQDPQFLNPSNWPTIGR